MKKSAFLFVLAAGTVLVGCGNDGENSSEGGSTKSHDAYSFTYDATYKVDVIAEQGGMDSFKQDVKDLTKGEVDLTEGNLYLHIAREGTDSGKSSKAEALVYKVENDYMFLTNTMGEAKKLAGEKEARAKIDELMLKVSHSKAGDISTSTAVYEKATWEHRELGLNTGNIPSDEFLDEEAFEYKVENGKITSGVPYIGYNTDAGVSDFPGRDGAAAATYEITVEENKYVTSYKETMAASLAMPIMNPAPVVTIDGTRTFSADYEATFEKKTTIDHQVTKGTIALPDLDTATVEVYTCKDKTAEKTLLKEGDEVIVGDYIAVKVTPAGSNTILVVSNNNTSLQSDGVDADGYFYFDVQEGVNKINVNIQGSDKVEGTKVGTLALPSDLQGCKVTAMTCAGESDVGNMKPADPASLSVGHWLCLKIETPEGKIVESVTNNGKAAIGGKEMFGFWVFTIEEGANAIAINLKDAGVAKVGKLVMPSDLKGYTVQVFTCKMGDFNNMKPADESTDLVVGEVLCCIIGKADGAVTATLTCNGNGPIAPTTATGGYYCFNIVEGNNVLAIVEA